MNLFDLYKSCTLCPRKCGVDRNISKGFCGQTDQLRVARASLHMWEEPCISGENGSGTVFFSGCNLKCVYCQNHQISADGFGEVITAEQLSKIFLNLQNQNAHNINLVTPTIWLPHIIKALQLAKPQLKIPVVYNTSGYETTRCLDILAPYVDIFLTDIKYCSAQLSAEYSAAQNYFETAIIAIHKMLEITGKPKYNEQNILQRGTIIRHMVLPSCHKDSIEILNYVAQNFEKDSFIFSLMSQYTPHFKAKEIKQLNRTISSFEYNKVVETAVQLGLENGYMQQKTSAKAEYTPRFDLTGV